MFRTNEIERGKGMWKMNVSILTSDVFRSVFLEKWSELQNDKSKYCDIQTWWDVVKRNIKYLAINVSIYLKRKEKERCSELEHRLDLLKTNTGDHKVFRDTEINTVKEELYAIYSNRGMGDKIRSRLQWWEEGEKSTKYFHNLEKARGKDKAWHKIKDKNGQLVYGTSHIQEYQVDFYKKNCLQPRESEMRMQKTVYLKNCTKR